jgi:hypothetical protein
VIGQNINKVLQLLSCRPTSTSFELWPRPASASTFAVNAIKIDTVLNLSNMMTKQEHGIAVSVAQLLHI